MLDVILSRCLLFTVKITIDVKYTDLKVNYKKQT